MIPSGYWASSVGGSEEVKLRIRQCQSVLDTCDRQDFTLFSFFPSPVAFLFNWIGFFLSFCLTSSAAGRYGAISGFGLSLIKWVLIVRVRAVIEYSVLPAQMLNSCSVVCCCGVTLQLPTGYFFFSSFPPISLVILMDSTGCGGCSWLWVSLRK